MQVTCPRCGAVGRLAQFVPGRRVACPRCKFAWVPEAPSTGSLPAPPPPPPPPPSALPSPGRWAVGWTIAAAIALVVGLAIPYLRRSFDGGEERLQAVGVWDLAEGQDFDSVLLLVQPAMLAVLATVAVLSFRGVARGIAVAAVAVAAVAVPEIIGKGQWFAPDAGAFALGATAQWLLLTGGAALTAGAAHARRKLPDSPLPCAGLAVGAVALLLGLLLPVGEGPAARSLLAGALESETWKRGAPVAAVLLASAAYAGLGLVAAIPGANLLPVARATSILARVVALGVPASLFAVAALYREEGQEPFLASAAGTLKWTLQVEGLLAVFGVGVGQALVSYVASRPARVPSRAPAAAPAPPAPAPSPAAAPPPGSIPMPPPAPRPAPASAPASAYAPPPAPTSPPPLVPYPPASSAGASAAPAPSPASPAPSGAAPSPARPALEELRLRLLPLLRAREEGLLTAEEYEAKRRRIIESIDF